MGFAQHPIDVRAHVRLLEDIAGEVHRDGQPVGGGDLPAPVLELPRRGLQHPLIDGDDQAGLLRQPEKLGGRHEPEPRMLPARERLDRPDLARHHVDDGHVVDAELVAHQRAAQVALHLHMGRRALDGFPLKHRGPRLAQCLGPVHGHVRVAQDVLGLLVLRRSHRHPDARAGLDALPANLEGLPHHLVHAVRHPHRVRRSAHVVEPHGELVAAVPREGIAFAQAGLQPPSDLLQELIAGLVAEGVVHHLEAVDVDEQHREAVILVAPGAIERVAQQIEEQRPVRQPGERVVPGVVRHPLHQRAVAGDVVHQPGGANGCSLLVASGGPARQHPAPVAVGVADAVLVLERVGMPFDVGGERGPQRGGVLGMNAVQPVARIAGSRRRTAHQLLPARGQVEAVRAKVPVPEHVGRAGERNRETVLPLADRVVLLHRLGLVAQHQRDPGDGSVATDAGQEHPVARERPAVAGRARQRAGHRLALPQRRAPLRRQVLRADRLEHLEDALARQLFPVRAAEPRRRGVRDADHQLGGELEHGHPALLEQAREAPLRLRRLLPPFLLPPPRGRRAALRPMQQCRHRGERLLQLRPLRVEFTVMGVDGGDQLTERRRQLGAKRGELPTEARVHR